MNRITTSGTLPGGKDFTSVVTRGHIVVRIADRILLSHNRRFPWFTVEEARGLLESMTIALEPSPEERLLHAPQPESDIPTEAEPHEQ